MLQICFNTKQWEIDQYENMYVNDLDANHHQRLCDNVQYRIWSGTIPEHIHGSLCPSPAEGVTKRTEGTRSQKESDGEEIKDFKRKWLHREKIVPRTSVISGKWSNSCVNQQYEKYEHKLWIIWIQTSVKNWQLVNKQDATTVYSWR